MTSSMVLEQISQLTQTGNWRQLMGLLDDGYRGMYVILKILQEKGGECGAGEMAKETGVSTARIATAINTLEKKGYVYRQSAIGDARKVVIHITKLGNEAMSERKKSIGIMIEPMLANLSDEESTQLFELLKKFLQ